MHEKNRTKSRNALYSSCLKGSDQLVNEMEKHLTAEEVEDWLGMRGERTRIWDEQGWVIYRRHELDIEEKVAQRNLKEKNRTQRHSALDEQTPQELPVVEEVEDAVAGKGGEEKEARS